MSRVVSTLNAARRWISGNRRGVAVAGIGALALSAVLVVAQPWSSTTYDLGDSGVWVTKKSQLGRANTQIAEIDYVTSREDAVQPLQDGRRVYLTDAAQQSVQILDPADPSADAEVVQFGEEAAVVAGGGVLVAEVGGSVSVVAVDGRKFAGDEIMDVGEAGQVAVGVDGTIAGFDPKTGRLSTATADDPDARTVDLDKIDGDFQISVIGSTPVVLDQSESRLLIDGSDPVDLSDLGASIQLQHPGPAADVVVVATETSFAAVGLSDGNSRVLSERGVGGTPVRPATDPECAFGAWADGGSFVTICDDEDAAVSDLLRSGGQWGFRTGGPVVVLNDNAEGQALYVVDGTIHLIDEWPEEQDNKTQTTRTLDRPPEPLGDRKPVAVADDLGARPGRTTLLEVLQNDTDEDGDVLAVAEIKPSDRLRITPGGRSIALTLAPEATAGSITFEYRVTDGHLTSDWATVTVDVVTTGNSAPRIKENLRLEFPVQASQQVAYDVLSAYWDPEGDPIYLAAVEEPPYGHSVTFEPAGEIRFTASDRVGDAAFNIEIRDDGGASVGGSVVAEVKAAGDANLLPQLSNDLAVGVVGQELVIEPLANDIDPRGAGLTLAKIEYVRGGVPEATLEGLGVTDASRVAFTPSEKGWAKLAYSVQSPASPDLQVATVLVQIDDPTSELAPIAGPDVLVVPAGRHSTVDLLANDVDPSNGMLAVTDINPSGGADPALAGINWAPKADLRSVGVDALASATPGASATEFSYTITNAAGRSADGVLSVVVVPTPVSRPPQAVRPAPVIPVRAGDVVTVPTSSFAIDPDGDQLTVTVADESLKDIAVPNAGAVRFFAPANRAGEKVIVAVDVTDPAGTTQNAAFVASILGSGESRPPVAKNIEARVRAGGSVLIPIPLQGIDPDGDSVRLVGRSGAAGLNGEVVADHARQAFVYRSTAALWSGMEEFKYTVVDSRGAQSAEATVRVFVSKAAPTNRAPRTVVDRVTAGPNRSLWVDPVANDVDLDGDRLELVADSVSALGVNDCRAESDEAGGVRIQSAPQVGTCTFEYAVIDTAPGKPGVGKSLPVKGQIEVQVLDAFPGVRPIARDDYPERGDDDRITVPILDNDDDPDGPRHELDATVIGGSESARVNGEGQLEVALADESQVVRYRITDADGLFADAVVRVPGRDDNRPPIEAANPPQLKMKADGDPLRITLSKHIVDPDGDKLSFTKAQSSQADATLLQSELANGIAVVKLPNADFSGETFVEVVATDPGKLSRTFSLKIEVESRKNRVPKWTGDPRVVVERAGTTQQFSLTGYVTDPDLGDLERLTFKGGTTEAGVEVTVSADGIMRITAGKQSSSTKNAKVEFEVGVKDDEQGAEFQQQTWTVEVRPSRAPELIGSNWSVKGKQGEPVTVDVADLIANADGKVTVQDPKVESGPGNATARGSGFIYTSPKDFAGDVTVRYVAIDELYETGRQKATGLVTIRIAGRPGVPTAVTATPIGSATIRVSWTNGPENYSATDYFVNPAPGSDSKPTECDNPCTLTSKNGIRNAKPYQFVVVAENEVGRSAQSLPSVAVTTDAPPAAPTNLRLNVVVKDSPEQSNEVGELEFTWKDAPGPDNASPTRDYEVVIGDKTYYPEQTSIRVPAPTGTSLCAKIKARNAVGSSTQVVSECVAAYGHPVVPMAEDLKSLVVPKEESDRAGSLAVAVSGNGSDLTSWSLSGCGDASVRPLSGPGQTVATDFDDCTSAAPELTLTVTNAAGLSSVRRFAPSLRSKPSLDARMMSVVPGLDSVIVNLPKLEGGGRRDFTWTYKVNGGREVPFSRGAEWIEIVDQTLRWTAPKVQVKVCAVKADSCSEWTDQVGPSDGRLVYGEPPPVLKPEVTWRVEGTELVGIERMGLVWTPDSPRLNKGNYRIRVSIDGVPVSLGGTQLAERSAGTTDVSGTVARFEVPPTGTQVAVLVTLCDERSGGPVCTETPWTLGVPAPPTAQPPP